MPDSPLPHSESPNQTVTEKSGLQAENQGVGKTTREEWRGELLAAYSRVRDTGSQRPNAIPEQESPGESTTTSES